MSTIAVNAITDAAGGNTATINGMTPTADSLQGFRNRIINGDMRIDQRNAGASVTVNALAAFYSSDRWYGFGQATDGVFTLQQDATAPSGFTNSIKATVTTADASISATNIYGIQQRIEGFNISDFGWGTAAAIPVTLSFWVRSSVTGSFGARVGNSAGNRSYPFSYTIDAANTWEQKSVTIPGDTTGTWLTNNGIGISLIFMLGAGSTFTGTANTWAAADLLAPTGSVQFISTSGATFYITGVQLEAGSVATPFERRPYGSELALCQRYYYKQQAVGTSDFFGGGQCTGTTTVVGISNFPTTMRTSPTALEQTGTAANYATYTGAGTTTACSAVPSFVLASVWQGTSAFTVASGLTTGQAAAMRSNNAAAYLAWSAEL